MTTAIANPLPIEKTIDNEWFNAPLVRNPDGKLFVHIEYKKWSPTARRKTKEAMDELGEPLYAFIHNMRHWKYLQSLGFEVTGEWVNCPFPGKEEEIFGEVVYIKGGIDKYCLQTYDDLGKIVLPVEYIDGYGNIEKIEEELKKLGKAEWTTKHHFSDGVYTRETFIPKGTMLTGYRHKQETVSILASGVITVVTVDKLGYAEDKGTLHAPMVLTTKAGIKKIGYAQEDTVFINSFSLAGLPSQSHNVESISTIEDYIFEKDGESSCQE